MEELLFSGRITVSNVMLPYAQPLIIQIQANRTDNRYLLGDSYVQETIQSLNSHCQFVSFSKKRNTTGEYCASVTKKLKRKKTSHAVVRDCRVVREWSEDEDDTKDVTENDHFLDVLVIPPSKLGRKS